MEEEEVRNKKHIMEEEEVRNKKHIMEEEEMNLRNLNTTNLDTSTEDECIMEEKKISEYEEKSNISPVKKQTEYSSFFSSFTKSYTKTRIESTTSSYAWEIDKFVHLTKTLDLLYSPSFPETSDHMIQINVIRTTEPLSTIHFSLLSKKAFTGSCTTTIKFPNGTAPLSRSISGRISTTTFLFDMKESQYNHCDDTDTLVIHCKLKIFHILMSNTVHLNSQLASTILSKDLSMFESFKDLNLDKFEGTSIKFIVGKEQYVIPKKLLLATNSNYFKNICFTHEEKEKDMTNELTDSELPAFQEMLVFIIIGSIRSNNYNMLQKLLITADKYDVATLKLMCEHYLLHYINVYNATELMQLAFSSNAAYLETHSATFIKLYIKEVMNTKEIQNLSQESANKILELIKKCKLHKFHTNNFFSSGPHIHKKFTS